MIHIVILTAIMHMLLYGKKIEDYEGTFEISKHEVYKKLANKGTPLYSKKT